MYIMSRAYKRKLVNNYLLYVRRLKTYALRSTVIFYDNNILLIIV